MNLRKSANGQPCCLRIVGVCRGEPACLNHIRGLRQDNPLMFRLAGGGSKKPDDRAGVFGCQRCHDVIDKRTRKRGDFVLTEGEKWHYIACALVETRVLQEQQ